MRKPYTGILITTILLCSMASMAASALTAQQQTYLQAKAALDKRQLTQYQKLRSRLNDYPLAIYLDYAVEIDKIIHYPAAKALETLEKYRDLPFYGSARYRYLMNTGRQGRWHDFLALSPTLPIDVRLQCFFHRARLATGQTEKAFKGAKRLWVHGYSRPAECDPLFDAWVKAGHRTQEVIWRRAFAAFDAGQSSLLSFLLQRVTQHADDAKLLLTVYKDPHHLRHMKAYRGKAPIVGDIVAAGLKRLAQKDLAEAIRLYMSYQQADRFSDYQGRSLNRYLVRRALVTQDPKYTTYVDTFLPLLESDDLYEQRLRWALRENDWISTEKYLALLSDQGKAHERWQYWQAYLAQTRNDTPRSQAMISNLAQGRNFYGFAAAQQLNGPVALNDTSATQDPDRQRVLIKDPGYLRFIELRALDKTIEARGEWLTLLRRHDNAARAQYGLLALKHSWYNLAVETSIAAQLWDDLTLRFPFAAPSEFVVASKRHKVNINEIRAIARRESAFYPYATSGAGARGLMQLMPATGRETARKLGLSIKEDKQLYQTQLNVQLGSAYYAGLLKQFDQNRILATAAYNAGPGNVRRWLAKSGGRLDVMRFIETIPFTETREYVQAVLSYRVIYETKQNKPQPLFSKAELNYSY
jgi:soluble lytic murein transglycosylase